MCQHAFVLVHALSHCHSYRLFLMTEVASIADIANTVIEVVQGTCSNTFHIYTLLILNLIG
jgi:hypothetical protein